ncbi:hypothetical protein NEAUS03_2363, partial [Nematocida ausubeli]
RLVITRCRSDWRGLQLLPSPPPIPPPVGVRKVGHVDHILVSANLAGKSIRTDRLEGWHISDHQPVFADFVLPRSEALPPRPDILRSAGVSKDILEDDGWTTVYAKRPQRAQSLSDLAWKLGKQHGWKPTSQRIGTQIYISTDTKKALQAKRRTDPLVTPKPILDTIRREARRLIARDRRAQWSKHIMKVTVAVAAKNSRSTWAWINAMSKKPTSGILGAAHPLKDPRTGALTADPARTSEIWADHFGGLAKDSLGLSKDEEMWKQRTDPMTPTWSECYDPITWETVYAALSVIPANKAPGIDGIASDFWKITLQDPEGTSKMAQAIWYNVQRCFENASLPTEWDEALVVPVPKKGDLSLPGNYRGIALMNTSLKIVTKIIDQRLQGICEKYGLLTKSQAGFRALEECSAQATVLYESLRRRQIQGLETNVFFVDFAKAYDKVPQAALLYKLERLGIGGPLLAAIRACYKSPKLAVRTQTGRSRAVDYECGVRQGCPSSPILFNIFIDDLARTLPAQCGIYVPESSRGPGVRIPALLFADDAVFLDSSDQGTQMAADHLHQWCNTWGMSVNASKCAILRVLPKGAQAPTTPNLRPAIAVGGEVVPNVSEYTYLGLRFCETLDLTVMVKARAQSARMCLQEIKTLLTNRSIPIIVRRDVIRMALVPRGTYGAELWGMSQTRAQHTQAVVNRACGMLGLAKRGLTSTLALQKELRIEPVAVYAAALRCRLWDKAPLLRTYLPDLIASPFRARDRTWVTQTVRWVNTRSTRLENQGGYIPAGGKDLPAATRALLDAIKASQAGKTKSGALAYRLAPQAIPWWRLQVLYPEEARGLRLIGLLRLSGLAFTAQLFHRLPGWEYLPRIACVACRSETETENLEHLLLECPEWRVQRLYLFDAIRLEIGALSQVSTNSLVDALLGGKLPKHAWRTMFRDYPETRAQCVDRSVSTTRAVARYLGAIIPLRSDLIRSYFVSHVPPPPAVKDINLLRPP